MGLQRGPDVTRDAQLKASDLLKLPRPPRPARVTIDGSEEPPPQNTDVTGSGVAAAEVTPNQGPLPKHCLLEKLLLRAEGLARSLSISDPRGRLLQIALLRRDHVLLDAVVRSAEASSQANTDAASLRQSSATWRPRAPATVRKPTTPSHVRPRRMTERPTLTPRRGR